MNWELIGIIGYIIVMMYIGYLVARNVKTDDDYFLAGRSLGPLLGTFSIFATWFGAESCVGTAGNVYRDGVGGAHGDPLGYTLCIVLMAVFFARVLWNKQITTLPDLFRTRYSPVAERLAAFIMIPSSLVWAGAQIRAFGHIIHVAAGLEVPLAVTLAAGVVILYTMFGGLLADAYHDLIQGIAILIGLAILFVVMIDGLGGPAAAWQRVTPESLDFFKAAPKGWMARWEMWLVPVLGSLMSQELVSRVSASRSAEVAVGSAWKAALLYMLIGLVPVSVGLLGHVYYPNLVETDSIMPLLAKQHLHAVLYVLFVGALVAAILSTVDSTLLAVSALATHNLLHLHLEDIPDRHKVLFARLGVVLSGLIAYGLTFSSDSVTEMVETASSLGGPTILVMVCFALFTRLGNHVSAIVAMVASLVAWFVGHFVVESQAPVIWTVLACLVSYLVTLPFVREAR